MEIIRARRPGDFAEIRRLFREYESSLGVDLCFQGFEAELDTLPGRYSPPGGVLLLARHGQRGLGCGALRRFGAPDQRIGELKRLYVRPEARGAGIGRAIAGRLIAEAVARGYHTLFLDTLDTLQAAMRLYESLGFERTAAYYDNPLPGVVYWRLDLGG